MSQHEASVSGALYRLAVPISMGLLGSTVTQLLVIGLVGLMGEEALYLRMVFTPLAFLFIALFDAMGASTQVAISIEAGRGPSDEPSRSTGSFLVLAELAGLTLAGVLALLAPSLARFLGVEQELAPELARFTRSMALANLTVLPAVVLLATLRGFGHARVAMVGDLIQAIGNLALVYGGGIVFGLGLFGLPWAGGLAGALAAAWGGAWLLRLRVARHSRPTWKSLRESSYFLQRVGVPVSLSTLMLFLSNLALIAIVARFGTYVVTGFGLVANIQAFVLLPALGLGSAISILVNQQLGAGNAERARLIFRTGVIHSAVLYAVTAACVFALGPAIVGLIAKHPEAARYATGYLRFVGPTYAVLGTALTTLTVMEHTGRGLLAVMLNVAYFASMVGTGGWLSIIHGDPAWIYYVTSASNLMGLTVVYLGFRRLWTAQEGGFDGLANVRKTERA